MIQIEKFSLKKPALVFIATFFVGIILVLWFQRTAQIEGQLPLGIDFYPRWVGSRAFWQGESPYSPEVESETQSYVFGRPAEGIDGTFGWLAHSYR